MLRSFQFVAVALVSMLPISSNAASVYFQDIDPTKPQLFHTNLSGGGLIEGACVKITDESFVLVKMADGKNISIPLELFETSEQQAICKHFEIELPKQAKAEKGTNRDEQHPWHSIRGGILCFGKIVSVEGDVIHIVDADGNLYRVPSVMLAQGAILRAEKDISKLDPKLVKKKGPNSSKTAKNAEKNGDKTGKVAAPDRVSMQGNGKRYEGNDEDVAVKLSGHNRNWNGVEGKPVATGKFRRGEENHVVIVNANGNETELAFRELSITDQNYIRLVEAGAVLDPKNDPAAVPETKVGSADTAKGMEHEKQKEKEPPTDGKPQPNKSPATLPGENPNLPPGLQNAIGKMKGKAEPNKEVPEKDASKSDSELLGNKRKWFDAKGETIAIGRFRRRVDIDKLTIVNDKGEEKEIEFRSLSNDHQIYVRGVEAGARIDIAADSAAIRREIPADKLRKWKMAGGLTIGMGEFVEMKNGKVTIFEVDQSTKDLPFDLLSDEDKQYAEAMSSGKGPSKAPDGAVRIASESALLAPTLDGKGILLIDGEELKLLSADGAKVISTNKLPAPATKIVERDEYYVVAAGRSLILLDKESFEVIGNHELWKFQKINDFTLHPKKKVAYVSVTNAAEEIRKNEDERNRVVMVDENTGKVTVPGEIFAVWMAMSPTGDVLYAGYKHVEKRSGGIHINPDGNIIENPKWDNTDVLMRYEVKANGLELHEQFENAGANGQGLVLSPNGKQIAYLSFTGYPTLSYNIALLDAKSFDKKPTTLVTKDVASCKQLAIHPTKPLAASPGGDAVVFFDTRTGKPIPAQPKIAEEIRGAAIHQLTFDTSGMNLMVQASVGGGERFVFAIAVPEEKVGQDSRNSSSIGEPSAAVRAKRTWTDKSGNFQVEAEFVGLKDDNVILRKSDGSTIEVQLSKLAPKDQLLARKLASEME